MFLKMDEKKLGHNFTLNQPQNTQQINYQEKSDKSWEVKGRIISHLLHDLQFLPLWGGSQLARTRVALLQNCTGAKWLSWSYVPAKGTKPQQWPTEERPSHLTDISYFLLMCALWVVSREMLFQLMWWPVGGMNFLFGTSVIFPEKLIKK